MKKRTGLKGHRAGKHFAGAGAGGQSVRMQITALLMAFALIATLLTGSIIYEQTERLLIEDAWTQQQILLDSACSVMNRRIEQIRSFSWQLSNQQDVKSILHTRQMSPQSILTIRNIITTLQTMKAFDGTIADIGLHVAGLDRVITAESSYNADTYFSHVSGMSLEQVAALRQANPGSLLGAYAGSISIERIIETESALVFVSALPVERAGGEDFIFFNLKMEEISSILSGVNSGLFLTDASGCAVSPNVEAEYEAMTRAYIGGPERQDRIRYNGKEYGLVIKPTDAAGLYCAAVVPYAALQSQANNSRKTVVLMMSVFMLLAMLTAVTVGKRVYAPLGQLMTSLRKLGHGLGAGNEYQLLADALHDYSATNHTLNLSWQETNRLLKNHVLRELIEGRLRDRQAEALRQAHIELIYPQVQVAVMATAPSTLRRQQEALGQEPADWVEEQMDAQAYGGMRVYCARREDGYLLLLFNIAANHSHPEKMDQFLREVCLQLDPACRIGVGKCYTQEHMADSLVDAMLALRGEGERRICYVEEADVSQDREFTLSAEQTLLRLIQSGDEEALCAFLQGLWEQEDGTVLLRGSLCQALLFAARRIARAGGMEEAFESLMKESGLRLNDLPETGETAEGIRRVYLALAQGMKNGVSTQEEKHLSALMTYIRQEYAQDISLDTASAATGLSPSYIGVIFRHANTSFLKALTEVRMARARELLASTTLTVREIGEQVGMANQNTFIRAFKKAEGITPGQYRMAETTMNNGI